MGSLCFVLLHSSPLLCFLLLLIFCLRWIFGCSALWPTAPLCGLDSASWLHCQLLIASFIIFVCFSFRLLTNCLMSLIHLFTPGQWQAIGCCWTVRVTPSHLGFPSSRAATSRGWGCELIGFLFYNVPFCFSLSSFISKSILGIIGHFLLTVQYVYVDMYKFIISLHFTIG